MSPHNKPKPRKTRRKKYYSKKERTYKYIIPKKTSEQFKIKDLELKYIPPEVLQDYFVAELNSYNPNLVIFDTNFFTPRGFLKRSLKQINDHFIYHKDGWHMCDDYALFSSDKSKKVIKELDSFFNKQGNFFEDPFNYPKETGIKTDWYVSELVINELNELLPHFENLKGTRTSKGIQSIVSIEQKVLEKIIFSLNSRSIPKGEGISSKNLYYSSDYDRFVDESLSDTDYHLFQLFVSEYSKNNRPFIFSGDSGLITSIKEFIGSERRHPPYSGIFQKRADFEFRTLKDIVLKTKNISI